MKRLATGGMAEIYLARSRGITGFEKIVVLKRILPQLATQPEFVRMFLDEARLAAALQHPNIVQTYDIGEEGGDYFMAMEYLHGEDVRTLMKTLRAQKRYLKRDHALRIGVDVCAGLHYAHVKTAPDGQPLNIVHRDVSPQNVIVTYEGSVKLLDFGIAKAAGRGETKYGTLKGKIGYMSPEQCRGEPLDRRSDVFAVSILLYELTVGKRLYRGTSEFEVLKRIVEGTVAPPRSLEPDYPEALEAIVMRGLEKEPHLRWQTTREMGQALEAYAHEARIGLSTMALGSYMEEVFGSKVEAWREAQREGKDLAQHIAALDPNEIALGDDDLVELDPDDLDDDAPVAPASIASIASIASLASIDRSPISGRVAVPKVIAPVASGPQPLPPAPSGPQALSPIPPGATPTGIKALDLPAEFDWGVANQAPAARPAVLPPVVTRSGFVASHFRSVAAVAAGVIACGGVAAVMMRPHKTQALAVSAAPVAQPVPAAEKVVEKAAPPAAAEAFGVLQVETSPRGARLLVDGKPLSAITPTTVDSLALARPHTLIVELPGYGSEVRQVTIPASGFVKLQIELKASATPGKVAASSVATATAPRHKLADPDEDTASAAPAKPPVAINHPAATPAAAPPPPAAATVAVAPAPVAAAPAPSNAPGRLLLNATPWAEVIIDGKDHGPTPLSTAISPGVHTVVLVSQQFHKSETLSLNVGPGETIKRKVAFTP